MITRRAAAVLAGLGLILGGCGATLPAQPPQAVAGTAQVEDIGALSSPNPSPAAGATEAPAVASAQPVTSPQPEVTPALAPAGPPPGPAIAPSGPKAMLGPLEYISQTLNNCGPASVAEVLDYWGISRTQAQVQAVLRADGNSHGMAPFGVPAYTASLGMNTLMGVGGSQQLVKSLVANGFPVIVSQWVSLTDHYGHYRPIEGYDDAKGVFIASDPYLGPNHQISYDEFGKIWNTNNRFMVIFPTAKQPLLLAVLAANGWDKKAAYQADLAKLQNFRQPLGSALGAYAGGRGGYSQLSLAWDQMELGNVDAANAALDAAIQQGAKQPTTDWIRQAIKLSA